MGDCYTKLGKNGKAIKVVMGLDSIKKYISIGYSENIIYKKSSNF